jgi:dihydroorotase
MRILITGGHVLDPGRLDGRLNILIENGAIAAIAPPADLGPDRCPDARTLDAAGLLVVPGLIDLHVHFREPGFEYKETIQTGCAAAVAGGFTAVCPMPNTRPAIDSGELTAFVRRQAAAAGLCRVYPVAAISRGLAGEELSPFAELKAAGAVAVSDDGNPVLNSRLMRQALTAARKNGLLVISHSEELSLAGGGAVNEGPVSERLGVGGIPNAAESIMVMRDIALCELTGAPLHIAHVSTAESVRAIRDAKERGIPVTAETAPHYFTLTDEAVIACGANAKMNPPLRAEKDRQAVREGLADGTLDAIATDHAPHAPAEKAGDLAKAANGIIGLETSLGLSLRLVAEGVLSLPDLIARMATRPAQILGLDNRLMPGNPADLTIIDLARRCTVDAAAFRSKSRNTPFDGWTLTGCALLTLVGGRVVFDARS